MMSNWWSLVRFGVMGGLLLCLLCVGLSYVVESVVLLRLWEYWSELVWLCLGIGFVRVYGDGVVHRTWKQIVVDFLFMNMVLVAVWAIGMWLVGMWLGIESQLVIGVSGGGWRDLFSEDWYSVVRFWVEEGMRLVFVGLVPVVGWRVFGTQLRKRE